MLTALTKSSPSTCIETQDNWQNPELNVAEVLSTVSDKIVFVIPYLEDPDLKCFGSLIIRLDGLE